MTWDAFFVSLINGDYGALNGNAIADLKKVEKLGDVNEIILALKYTCIPVRYSIYEFLVRRINKEKINVENDLIYSLYNSIRWNRGDSLQDDFLISYEIDIETHEDPRFLEKCCSNDVGVKYYKFLYKMRYGTLEGYEISWLPEKVLKIKQKRDEAFKNSKK